MQLRNPNLTNLKKIREQRNLTCLDVALALGLNTHSAYLKKEQGSIKISLQEALIIASLFDDSLENIFFPSDVRK